MDRQADRDDPWKVLGRNILLRPSSSRCRGRHSAWDVGCWSCGAGFAVCYVVKGGEGLLTLCRRRKKNTGCILFSRRKLTRALHYPSPLDRGAGRQLLYWSPSSSSSNACSHLCRGFHLLASVRTTRERGVDAYLDGIDGVNLPGRDPAGAAVGSGLGAAAGAPGERWRRVSYSPSQKKKSQSRFLFPGGKSPEPSPPFTNPPPGRSQWWARPPAAGRYSVPDRLLYIPRPFDHPDFIREPKLDGVGRTSVGHQCELVSRNAHTSTLWLRHAGDPRTQSAHIQFS